MDITLFIFTFLLCFDYPEFLEIICCKNKNRDMNLLVKLRVISYLTSYNNNRKKVIKRLQVTSLCLKKCIIEVYFYLLTYLYELNLEYNRVLIPQHTALA